jgi:hypothetical protein
MTGWGYSKIQSQNAKLKYKLNVIYKTTIKCIIFLVYGVSFVLKSVEYNQILCNN